MRLLRLTLLKMSSLRFPKAGTASAAVLLLWLVLHNGSSTAPSTPHVLPHVVARIERKDKDGAQADADTASS